MHCDWLAIVFIQWALEDGRAAEATEKGSEGKRHNYGTTWGRPLPSGRKVRLNKKYSYIYILLVPARICSKSQQEVRNE